MTKRTTAKAKAYIAAAKQRAFEVGADYAKKYIDDMIENLAKGIEDYDPGAAFLLRYVSDNVSDYQCGEYGE